MVGCLVVNIWCKKCKYREGICIISVVRYKEIFEMFEVKFKCLNFLLNILLSLIENGFWLVFDDEILFDLYQVFMGVVFRIFFDIKYVKFECIEELEEEIQDQVIGVNFLNVF